MNGKATAVTRPQPLAEWRSAPGNPVRAQSLLEVALAALPAGEPPLTAEADLGTTARLVSRLVSQALAAGGPAPVITSAAPLSAEPGNATRVAAGLKEAIKTSGLFYESHLAGWVEGTASKVELLREPQAALALPAGPAATAQPHHLAPGAEALIQRQLDVLEHRSAYWQGEAWPGQGAEVHIAEDETGSNSQPGGGGAWQASLRLSMKGLGELQARIGLTGSSARLTISTLGKHSAATLLAERGDLARALGEQGLRLADVKVEHERRDTPR